MKSLFIILFISYYVIKKHSNCSSIISLSSLNSTKISVIQNFVLLIHKTNNFCQANQFCSNYGKINNQISNVIGQNYKLAIKHFFNYSFWIKINQMNILQIKYSNSTNFWINEYSKLILMNELESNLRSYGNHNEQFQYHGKYNTFYNHFDGKLQTTLSNRIDEINIICEIKDYTNHNDFIQLRLFQKCLNVSSEELFSPHKNFDGCYIQNIKSSLQYCAYSCAKDEYCTRFYYNNLTKDCIVTQYIVSLIPTYHENRGNGWDCYSLNVNN
ncbi:unnamed protein product [Schistosoma margrebowiei]|uniref:Apple domain-containing protein n=1 Tax=Schistosoma margrebowiei TaxID=48269 RepID=A0AA84ZP00_9TREM|nr:unnamed protein product [Schistosoma margrebowiei]